MTYDINSFDELVYLLYTENPTYRCLVSYIVNKNVFSYDE